MCDLHEGYVSGRPWPTAITYMRLANIEISLASTQFDQRLCWLHVETVIPEVPIECTVESLRLHG